MSFKYKYILKVFIGWSWRIISGFISSVFSLVCVLGGPLDLMSRRVVAAGTREIADCVVKQLQPINYGRDDTDPDDLA